MESEALAFRTGPGENGGFDDSCMIALASTLSPEGMMVLVGWANRSDWKQAAAGCGMSVEQGNRTPVRIRYRANKISDGFDGYSLETNKAPLIWSQRVTHQAEPDTAVLSAR